MYDVWGENLSNSFSTKIREKLNRINICLQRAIFAPIDRYQGNTCEIFKMINMITGKHIPEESIKLSNVFARNRHDSGQIPPAIFRPWECVHKSFLNATGKYSLCKSVAPHPLLEYKRASMILGLQRRRVYFLSAWGFNLWDHSQQHDEVDYHPHHLTE
jgi:hypothetical protein